MKTKFKNHPAVILGRWLKDKRIEKGLTLREFSIQIGIKPSIGSDIMLGINMKRNLTDKLIIKINKVLKLSIKDGDILHEGFKNIQLATNIKMKDLFTRAELMPAFPFRLDEKTDKIINFTKKQINKLVDQVLKDK